MADSALGRDTSFCITRLRPLNTGRGDLNERGAELHARGEYSERIRLSDTRTLVSTSKHAVAISALAVPLQDELL